MSYTSLLTLMLTSIEKTAKLASDLMTANLLNATKPYREA